jgi:hypothetical protein
MATRSTVVFMVNSILQPAIGAAGYFLSYFAVNIELSALRFLAVGAIMTGFVLGGIAISSLTLRVVGYLAAINLVVMIVTTLLYMRMSTAGQADVWYINMMSIFLVCAFFSMGFVVPLASGATKSSPPPISSRSRRRRPRALAAAVNPEGSDQVNPAQGGEP